MGNDMLNASASSYTIMGLTPSTVYTVTLIAINQCGNGTENVVDVVTGDGSGPTTPSDGTTTASDSPTNNPTNNSTNNSTENNNQTATINPS